MIQQTVTSRNVTEVNVSINKFWKGSHWFCRECLRTFCYLLWPESRIHLFGKLDLCSSVFIQSSSNWPSVLHLLHVDATAILADGLTHVSSFECLLLFLSHLNKDSTNHSTETTLNITQQAFYQSFVT